MDSTQLNIILKTATAGTNFAQKYGDPNQAFWGQKALAKKKMKMQMDQQEKPLSFEYDAAGNPV